VATASRPGAEGTARRARRGGARRGQRDRELRHRGLAAIAAATTRYTAAALGALVASRRRQRHGAARSAESVGTVERFWSRRSARDAGPGAMSFEGTAAGLLAALALAAIGAGLGLIPASAILIVVAAATAGALVESALGGTLEGLGILNNDMLNVINTAVAAAVVLVML
jgi:hypothetical protein